MVDIFRQTLLDGVGKTNKGWTVTLSFAAEVIAIGLLILIPLIFTDVLPKAQAVNMLTAPAPPPPSPPPTVQKVVVKQPPRLFDAGRLTAPIGIPKQVAIIQEEALSLSTSSAVAGPPGIPGGVSTDAFDAIATVPPPAVAPSAATQVRPAAPVRIRVGGIVQSAKLIKKPVPVYPSLARQARIQGTVKFTAIIGRDGAIQNLTLLTGHPLLVQAAQDAVKQWVYQPTLLNGEPVEVVTEIDVNFALSNN